MTPKIEWLDTPTVFRVGQLPAHSDHKYYATQAEMLQQKSSFEQSLNGMWQFNYSINAASRPKKFYQTDFDAEQFETIPVPQHIELSGYEQLHYINTMYPWEGHEYRRPAFSDTDLNQYAGMFSEAEYNPVGSYLNHFDLEPTLQNKRVIIRFEGVEQAMYVWLNGHFIGYAEDSFTPSEFDLTPYLKDKDNCLAVEVHKRSSAAFIEDQDFFRFFGIFRDVTLLAQPATHLDDFWVIPNYDSGQKTGQVDLQLHFSGTEQRVRVTFKDQDAVLFSDELMSGSDVEKHYNLAQPVTAWQNDRPYLYTLQLEILDTDGQLIEVINQSVGFRKIEIKNRVMLLNGERLIINGVNRHEWNPKTGRTISDNDEAWDVACMQRNNINAVRTSHYPDRLSFYNRCDQAGIYMMAETNLESHGSWQKMGAVEPSWNVPGSSDQWEAAVLDRAKSNFELFKNHPSVLFWSLGNESYAGSVLEKMNEYYKQKDSTRLVHYEGVFRAPEYKDVISDVESRMYATPAEIKDYLENSPQKPFILCEYMHDMGNSLGGMKSYIDLLQQYESYQGGFIWDFIDQALLVEDPVTGQNELRYGGDFDDRPSDYAFSGDGLVFATRNEKPAMQEVKYYYGTDK
ncbi:glycoside hydrolase family 2 TIM barrel-domain containing protein [Dellaglioa sp. P0083]|uniref:glycoside hydrolase family 2 TIM barrel-domain containing protein n=1 Tax=Dellaglioa kimchii TaxID=3344667 RepID=UPI0038D3800F